MIVQAFDKSILWPPVLANLIQKVSEYIKLNNVLKFVEIEKYIFTFIISLVFDQLDNGSVYTAFFFGHSISDGTITLKIYFKNTNFPNTKSSLKWLWKTMRKSNVYLNMFLNHSFYFIFKLLPNNVRYLKEKLYEMGIAFQSN